MKNNSIGELELMCPTCDKKYKVGQITCTSCARVLSVNSYVIKGTRNNSLKTLNGLAPE